MNDLSYWGLDYPPLSAYQVSAVPALLPVTCGSRLAERLVLPAQSWVCGKLIGAVEPMAMALGSSRGYETPSSKLLMRLTVLLSDLLCESVWTSGLLTAR